MDIFDVHGRVALVTGASSGLGRHFALVLARAGATVLACARREAALRELAEEAAAAGGKVLAASLDVTDPASIERALDTAVGECGGLHILVNNAGIAMTASALEVTENDWDRLMDTNLKGAFLVAQGAAKRMREGGGGSIVNIASIAGMRVAGRISTYGASKAALIHLTRSLALELARDGVRVNAIAPGYIETDINREFFDTPAGEALIKRVPQRRLGQPEDLDGALLLLASDAGRFMTGSVLAVDGGHLQSSL